MVKFRFAVDPTKHSPQRFVIECDERADKQEQTDEGHAADSRDGRGSRSTARDAMSFSRKWMPWAKLCMLTEPVYPKGEGAGRPTVGLERMLRIYFLQEWFNLSGRRRVPV